VDLFALNNCVKIVRQAGKEYYDSCKADEDDELETQDADLAGAALKVFLALFREKTEFADEEAAADFLDLLELPDDPHALCLILSWTHELYDELCARVNKGPMEACTASELLILIEPWIQTTENPIIEMDDTLESCVWPFVRLAR
jgi:hypothetical protein